MNEQGHGAAFKEYCADAFEWYTEGTKYPHDAPLPAHRKEDYMRWFVCGLETSRSKAKVIDNAVDFALVNYPTLREDYVARGEEYKARRDGDTTDNAKPDMVNHPPHYTSHPSGVECIQITRHMPFCIGNAVKYLWRADEKGTQLQDLRKAIWYIECEIARITEDQS
jgi:hypothetical protein